MSAHWTTRNLLSVDCESTGVDPTSDRIVEVAAVTISPASEVVDSWCRIVNPGIEIPEGAANVHGITTARAVAEGCDPVEALTELADIIKRHDGAVVLYQARFDWPLLATEAARHGIAWPGAMILDPLVLDKHCDKYRKGGRKLVDLARHTGVPLAEDDAHGATADATAAGQIMWRLLAAEPRMAALGLPELQTWQQKWSDEQRLSFAEYRARTGNPIPDEPLGWPLPQASAA